MGPLKPSAFHEGMFSPLRVEKEEVSPPSSQEPPAMKSLNSSSSPSESASQEASTPGASLSPFSSQVALAFTKRSSPSSSSPVSTHLPREEPQPALVLASVSSSSCQGREPPRTQPPVPVSKAPSTLSKLLSSIASNVHFPCLSFLKTLALFLATIILSLPSGAMADRESAYFDSASSITIPNYTWDKTKTMQVTFRTCTANGGLLSLVDGSSSSTSSSSSSFTSSEGDHHLTLSIISGNVSLSWSVSGQSHAMALRIGHSVSDDRWHQVRLRYQLEAVYLTLYGEGFATILGEVAVANSSYNSFLLDTT